MSVMALCSRADLLRALDASSALADTVARQLGLQERENPEPPSITVGFSSAPQPLPAPEDEEPASEPTAVRQRLSYHRLLRAERLSSEDSAPELGSTEAPPRRFAAPRAPPLAPLCPWSRLWPRLEGALGTRREILRVDLARAVESLSRGELLRRIPRLTHRRLPRRLCVVVDRAEALMPFWHDQDLVCAGLERRLGRDRIRIELLTDGTFASGTRRHAADVVLMLSELGSLEAAEVQNEFRRWAIQLERHGTTCVALVPLPLHRIAPPLRHAWRALPWEQASTRAIGEAPHPDVLRERARALLTLVSPAVRIETGLLRVIRRAVLPEADAGTEADAWRDRAVDFRAASAMALAPHEGLRLRESFAKAAPSQIRAVIDAIFSHHASLAPEILAEELTSIGMLVPSTMYNEERGTKMRWAIQHVRWEATRQLDLPADTAEQDTAWYRRLSRRLDSATWNDSFLGGPLRRAYVRAHPGRTTDLPSGLTLRPSDFAAESSASVRPKRYEIYQVGTTLRVLPESVRPGSANATRGIQLGHVYAARPQLDVRPLDESAVPWFQLDLRVHRSCELPRADRYVLETDQGRYLFERCHRPAWAASITADRDGLHATAVLDDKECRLRWRVLSQEGAWLADDVPAWATSFGCDQFGLWAEFDLAGVLHRLRWLPGGRFTMGSASDEEGRLEDEVQHDVVLSRGFWLGETACTYALWRAVMGTTRDHECAGDQPVAHVSWDDGRRFCERAEKLLPGLKLRLPTEAEWEYGCRAGTHTPFWFGKSVSAEQVNFDGSSLVSGAGAEARKQSVAVQSLPPNGWGLYEVHGNMWEWCQDWYGRYAGGTQRAPGGAAHGTRRVLRGGSWRFPARFARSAMRYANLPNHRADDIGFRLAKG